ncbi:MAG: tetratricopeptide repeat protein [Rhodospirillales bacterium]
MKRFLLTAALIAFAASAAAPALADPVQVRAFRKADGAARIDFVWPRAAPYEAVQEGRTVTVRFGRRIEADFTNAMRRIPDFVRAVSAGPDGRTVVINLNRDAEVLNYPSGALVILEMLPLGPPDPPGAAPAPATEAETAADGVPSVPVRTGRHTDKTRLVFDWPEKVEYTLESEDGVNTLTFRAPARIDADRFGGGRVRDIGGARAETGDDETRVIFTTPPSSKIRHFHSGSKVVFDIPRASDGRPAPPLPAPVSAAAAAPASLEAATEPETETGAETETAEAVEAAPAAGAETETAPETAAAQESEAPAPAETAETTEPGAPSPSPSPPSALAPDAPQALEPSDRAQTVAAEALQTLYEGGDSGPGRKIRFSSGAPLGLAAFRRAGAVWLVFDDELAVDMIDVMREGGDMVTNVRQIAVFGATVLRLDTPPGVNPDIQLEGFDWVLEMKRQPAAIVSTVGVNAKVERGIAPRIVLSAAGGKKVVAFSDPEVGDNLIAVPTRQPGQGVARAYTYPQVRIRPTLQGVAIEPRADGIRVQPLGLNIEVTLERGQFSITSSDPKKRGLDERPLSRILDLEPWGEADLVLFADRRRELLRAVTQTPPGQKEEKWRELALLYVANAYGAEALGVLTLMRDEREEIEDEAEFRMLRGVARYLLGRDAAAKEDFSHESVQGVDEAVFWAAVTSTSLAQPMTRAAAAGFRERGRIPDPYPGRLRTPLALLALEAVIVSGDITRAEAYMDEMRKQAFAFLTQSGDMPEGEEGGDGAEGEDGAEDGEAETGDAAAEGAEGAEGEGEAADAETPAEDGEGGEGGEDDTAAEEAGPVLLMTDAARARLSFIEGLLKQELNELDQALGLWSYAEAGAHRPTRARAAVARIEATLERGDITAAQAIEDYEQLRFAWRGDEFELNLLRRLGDLYMQENGYREGLYALRQAAIHFNKNEAAKQITERMSDVFQELFLDGKADALAPVKAIGIYQEFKELTPAGERGDALIRKLADRLVNVDLLPDAAELLETQVEFRLQGVEKTRVGAQLALVRIMNGEYQRALDTLGATTGQDTPPELREQRRHLRARALVGLEQKEAALTILENDESVGANLLRAEVYVAGENWGFAAKAFRGLARAYGAKPRRPLDRRQARTILDMATAFTLSGNERALGLLRRNFGPQMAASDYADAFKLISAPVSFSLIDRGRIPRTVAQAAAFQTFLSDYKERLEDAPLSAIN